LNLIFEALAYSFLGCGIAFLVSVAAIPPVKRIAIAVRALDYPGGRRVQAEAVPRLGGVAVVLGLFVAQLIVVLLRWGPWKAQNTFVQLVVIPLAMILTFVCGLVEDTVGVPSIIRLFIQVVSGILVISVGWSFSVIYLPFVGNVKLGMLTKLISLVWIVGVTNAINFLDGLDGLAGGVVAIIASTLLAFSVWHHDSVTAIIMGTIVGACIGFLRKNWAPAQIYLGDAGSLTLGFILAVVSIHSSIKAPAAVVIMVPVLALGLPVIDTLLVMIFRFTQSSAPASLVSRARRMFYADHSHVHHLLLGLGVSRRRIVITLYLVAVAFCAMALVAAASRTITLGMVLVGLEILVVVTMRKLGMHASAVRISLQKRRGATKALVGNVTAVMTALASEELYHTESVRNA
jgi:UDP-GlcNAc:undecaprenyl-phosphate GlcNAc-1-phosphate transferase